MSESLAKKYADMIAKEDAKYLLSSLLRAERLTEIARKCGLTRRSLYKLEERKDIRFRTKMKILRACIEASPNKTLGFLVRRSKDKTVSILMTYLSSLYTEAIQKTSAEEFRNALLSFLEARTRHFGLISDEIDSEVNTMLRFLEESALKFGIELPPEPLNTTKPEHLLRTIPFLINSLYLREENPKNLAKMYNVPLEWTQVISSAIGSISLPRIKIEEIEKPKLLTAAGTFAPSVFRAEFTSKSPQEPLAATLPSAA